MLDALKYLPMRDTVSIPQLLHELREHSPYATGFRLLADEYKALASLVKAGTATPEQVRAHDEIGAAIGILTADYRQHVLTPYTQVKAKAAAEAR